LIGDDQVANEHGGTLKFVTRSLLSCQETAQLNWAQALRTYRSALTTYHGCLQVKAGRNPSPRDVDQLDSAAAPLKLDRVVAARTTLDGLTPRELEVADLIARGYSNQQIAVVLVLTRGTVANHVAHILGKVGVTNRTQIAARVLDHSAAERTVTLLTGLQQRRLG
jgi:DNA-binding CsgD family transcriptional regulator